MGAGGQKTKLMKKQHPFRRGWLLILFFTTSLVTFASESAQLTITNRSNRTLTVKVMKQTGGLYTTLHVGAQQSRTCYIAQQGYYYTKTKAEKSFSETLYSQDNAFFVQNNSHGYSVLSITYWIEESQYPQSSGARISKSQFESDEK